MISNRINICCIYIVSVLIYLTNRNWLAIYIFLFCPPRVGICSCHSIVSSVPLVILLFEEIM